MGGTVSSGESNEELVNNLVEAKYIVKAEIERVFRAVDRGHFFPEAALEYADLPYRDVAWKDGHIHISAPCIYSEVMGNLELKAGLSFLNLGSGTGYLSTLAGLLLGANGVNHGVEMYEDVVHFAETRVAQFINTTSALDEFEFCHPRFVCGNALLLPAGIKYDRVYCGAACHEDAVVEYLKGLIKVGGVLITPVNSELKLFHRISEFEWTNRVLLPVAFASLILPMEPHMRVPILPRTSPRTLEDLCRLSIRSFLRQNILKEHPELLESKMAMRCRMRKKRKASSYYADSDIEVELEDINEDTATITFVSHRIKTDSGIVEDLDDELENVNWDNGGSETDSDVATSPETVKIPSFSDLMKEKIKSLELPKPVLHYLNMGRVL